MVARPDRDSRILGPTTLRGRHGWTGARGAPGLRALLTRPCRKPRPCGRLAKVRASYPFCVLVSVWKKHPHQQPTGYGNSIVSQFSLKPRKAKLPFPVAGFLWARLATLSNTCAWPVHLMAGHALVTLLGLHGSSR